MSVAAYIDRLRADLAAEVPSRLHTEAMPVTRDRQGVPEPTYGNVTGLPYTVAFLRYIGHPDGCGRHCNG
jgi:hypothetical protein